MGIVPIIEWGFDAAVVLLVLAAIGGLYALGKLAVWLWKKVRG